MGCAGKSSDSSALAGARKPPCSRKSRRPTRESRGAANRAAAAEHAGTACNADARYSCSKRWHHQMRESRETWLGEALVGETVPEWKQDAVNVEEEHGP